MDCDQNPVTLGSYLDGELPAEQADSVREHIGGCGKCAAEFADLVVVRRALRPARGLFTPSAEFGGGSNGKSKYPGAAHWSGG